MSGHWRNSTVSVDIDKIMRMYRNNKFKTEIIQIPHFEPQVIRYELEWGDLPEGKDYMYIRNV